MTTLPGWPYCTGSPIARVAALHWWPYCTGHRWRCRRGAPSRSSATGHPVRLLMQCRAWDGRRPEDLRLAGGRPDCTGGLIARVAILYVWPYCTGGRIARRPEDLRLFYIPFSASSPRFARDGAGAPHRPAEKMQLNTTSNCNVAARAIRPLVQYGQPCNVATRAIWPPMQYGHPCNMATCATWPAALRDGKLQKRKRECMPPYQSSTVQ